MQDTWRRFEAPPLLWASTALLAASSVVLELARYGLRRAHVRVYRVRLAICVCLGLLFLGLQAAAGADLIEQGVGAAGNPHGSAFYLFMGIHGAHFSFGILWLGYLLIRSGKLVGEVSENDLRRHRTVASVAATYWHFMGVVWALLFYFLLRWTAG